MPNDEALNFIGIKLITRGQTAVILPSPHNRTRSAIRSHSFIRGTNKWFEIMNAKNTHLDRTQSSPNAILPSCYRPTPCSCFRSTRRPPGHQTRSTSVPRSSTPPAHGKSSPTRRQTIRETSDQSFRTARPW